MILAIGEILYDVFPEYKRLGGAPFNFAFHLNSMGARVCLASRVGADPNGNAILQQLQEAGFDTSQIQIDGKNRTGEVLIKIDENGEPDFNISPDVAYDYINYKQVINIMKRETVNLIYFGSLVQRSEYGFATLQRVLLSKSPATKCLYDVNLRPKCYDKELINASLKQADLLKVNEAELEEIKRLLKAERQSDAVFIDFLMSCNHIEMVALTRGEKGSDLFIPEYHYAVKAPPIGKKINSVGAGDAYASVLATGYLCGWHPREILAKATAFAARICEVEGAIPDKSSFYDDWRMLCDKVTNE
jgi:fructokinase